MTTLPGTKNAVCSLFLVFISSFFFFWSKKNKFHVGIEIKMILGLLVITVWWLKLNFNKHFFLEFNLVLKFSFKNSQQCCLEPKRRYEDVFQFSSSVPSWSKKHPSLHEEVYRGCQECPLMMKVLQSKQLLRSELQPFEKV